MTETIIYSDLAFDFIQTSEGDIGVIENIEAVKQSIKNIILTPYGSRTRYQDPHFGCGVFGLIGEKISPVNSILIQDEIENALSNYEPRVELLEVNVETSTQTNSYNILVKYKILAINFEDDLVLDLEILK